jgi:hypothetical protein
VVDIEIVWPVQLYVLGIGKLGWVAASCDEGEQDAVSLLDVDGSWAVSEHLFRCGSISKDPERWCGETEAGMDD